MERRITLRRMLSEVIEDQLSINATLPRTLRALLLHPGLLSSEYIDGRIQRYVPPFRLYLVASVVFFLLLSFLSAGGNRLVHVGDMTAADTTRTLREIIERADTGATGRRALELRPFRSGWAPLDSIGNRRTEELLDLPPQQAARSLMRDMLQRAPTAVFLMLPLYALLLQLLYFRRRRYYVEHFVFALHVHAFVFVLFTIMLLGARVPMIGAPVLLWLVAYGFLALRRFYGGGWLSTLVKYGVLGAAYFVVFSAGVTFTVLAALLLA